MRSVTLAIAYFVAEVALDATVIWILLTHGHQWWAMIFAIFAGFSANTNVKRYMGVPNDET